MTTINPLASPATMNPMSKPASAKNANFSAQMQAAQAGRPAGPASQAGGTKLSYLEELKSQQAKKIQDEQRKTGGGQQLTQEDFLAILTKQLAQQDPSNPVNNDQMIAQMASFATVDGIGKMNKNFESLNSTMTSSQALQASSLVGQDVLIREPTATKTAEGGMAAIASLKGTAENLIVKIESSTGELVKTINLGKISEGDQRINWDGKDEEGNPLPAGNYTFNATSMFNGKGESVPISTYANVESVLLGKGDGNVMLNLSGHKTPVRLSDALQVGKIDQNS